MGNLCHRGCCSKEIFGLQLEAVLYNVCTLESFWDYANTWIRFEGKGFGCLSWALTERLKDVHTGTHRYIQVSNQKAMQRVLLSLALCQSTYKLHVLLNLQSKLTLDIYLDL